MLQTHERKTYQPKPSDEEGVSEGKREQDETINVPGIHENSAKRGITSPPPPPPPP